MLDFKLSSSVRKLSLQYLSLDDYLEKNTELFRIESAFEVKRDIEDTIQRVTPEFNHEGNFVKCAGWARMATPIEKFTLHYIAPALLGEQVPSKVMAEVEYSIAGMPNYLKKEWEELSIHDIVFLVSLQQQSQSFNVKLIRGCEITSHLDEKSKRITKKSHPEGKLRTLQLLLDPSQYTTDLQLETKSQKIAELYGDFHILIRRPAKTNIFKPVLSTLNNIRTTQGSLGLGDKIMEIILGYGQPEQDSSSLLSEQIVENKIDMFDLFVDQQHYEECFINNHLIHENIKKCCKWDSNSYQLLQKPQRNPLKFTQPQTSSILSSLQQSLTLILGPPGTGKTDTTVQLLTLLLHNYPNQRVILLTHSNKALDDLIGKLEEAGVGDRVVRLGSGGKRNWNSEFGKQGRVNQVLLKRLKLLEEVKKIQSIVGGKIAEEVTCETAGVFFREVLSKKWEDWRAKVEGVESYQEVIDSCPIIKYLNIKEESGKEEVVRRLDYEWEIIRRNIFEELGEIHAFEILRANKERQNYIVTQYSRIVAMTCTFAAMRRDYFLEIGFTYDSIVCEEAAQILEIETFISLTLQKSYNTKDKSKLKRIVLIGDENQLPPIIKHSWFQQQANMELSLFKRLIRLGFHKFVLEHQGRARETILQLYQWNYPNLKSIEQLNFNQQKNQGFVYDYQFIEVNEFEGKGEICPTKHFYQNLQEAEYVVATYMYMVLKGYDPKKISILTTYNGQKFLIRDVLKAKCSWNSQFGSPKTVTTVDKYQGQQNDFILLSLVRTKHIGHLKDPRRLIVAISRARLGLYVFGKFDVFANYKEIKKTFDLFKERPRQLCLQMTEDQIIKPENFQELYKIVIGMINEDNNNNNENK